MPGGASKPFTIYALRSQQRHLPGFLVCRRWREIHQPFPSPHFRAGHLDCQTRRLWISTRQHSKSLLKAIFPLGGNLGLRPKVVIYAHRATTGAVDGWPRPRRVARRITPRVVASVEMSGDVCGWSRSISSYKLRRCVASTPPPLGMGRLFIQLLRKRTC